MEEKSNIKVSRDFFFPPGEVAGQKNELKTLFLQVLLGNTGFPVVQELSHYHLFSESPLFP